MNTTIVSGINTYGQARLHIGDHNEHHDHRYYGDESQLPPTERQRAREDAILSSLYFTDMNARERAIDSPCDGTFGWIFDKKVREREPDYGPKDVCNLLSKWLEYEHGIFFIVGKAGSGKSTLMRFLAGHKKTSTLLHSWARRLDCTLNVCAHYFWCSGSELQSSQEGLLRSILHAIAKADPRLASAMFADHARDVGQTLAQLRSQPWARNDLISILSLLVAQLEVQKAAVCLFIDGLDEYQGDEMMLIVELRQLLRSPYIKICASSRPRNLFEEAFGYEDYQWKLALHLLTRGDMVRLAHTRLYDDDAFCKLVDCKDRRQNFVTAITDRSQGVFLWTVLVVREMIRESHQAGTIDELKAHLDALPIELGGERGMYQRIFERSDPRYRKYMARLLLVMLEAELATVYWEDVHFLYYDARDAAFATRECLGLDDKYRVAWDKKAKEVISQSSHWGAEDNDTSCRGLFLACHEGRSEAHPRGVNCGIHRIRLNEDTRQQVRKWCPDFVDTNQRTLLNFLHRSVGEYLSLPKIREQMTDLAGVEFDPVLTRCYLRLAYSRLQSDLGRMFNREVQFLKMIACVGEGRREDVRAILPEFERIQNTKWSLISVKEREGHILYGNWAKILCCDMAHEHFLHGSFDISHNSQAHA
jgi:energy-coupling factor transporter ATP-binding protein EcfA2